MTRIIAGTARGLRIEVPGTGTRPTSDRVRESLFGALESAGPSPMSECWICMPVPERPGLEALSRGAASLDLVERSRPAAAIVRRNAVVVAKNRHRRLTCA